MNDLLNAATKIERVIKRFQKKSHFVCGKYQKIS